jgi:ribonuclease-3
MTIDKLTGNADDEDASLRTLSESLGHTFSDISLLRQALIHRSFIAESEEVDTNERLEFLGDAVLGWVVADLAYHRLPDDSEGRLSDLRQSVVNASALADIARSLDLGSYVFLGRGENAAGGRDKTSILSDAFEAVIGAVYLDAGPQAADAFVRRFLTDVVEEVLPRLDSFDNKTRLQELCSQLSLSAPKYETDGEGPEHEKIFTAVVIVDGRVRGRGTGRTKKAAEQMAAERALIDLRHVNDPSDL